MTTTAPSTAGIVGGSTPHSWSEDLIARPALPLEEVIRPYGAVGSLSFLDISGGRDTVGYEGLARRVATAGARLRSAGVRPGDPVAITLTNTLPSVVAGLGVWAAGGTLVSVPPEPRGGGELYADRFGSVLDALGCRVFLADGKSTLDGHTAVRVPVDSLQGEDGGPLPDLEVPDTALVQFTSGSLGAPRGVAISSRALSGHLAMIGNCYSHDPHSDVIASWLPLYHDLGFICFFLTGLASRVTQVHAEPRSFVMRPASWLSLLDAEKATLSGGPNFAFRLASRVPYPEGLDLSRVRSVMNAAERVAWPDVVDFHRAGEPFGLAWEAIMPAYGLAESTVGVTTTVPMSTGPVLGPHGLVGAGPVLPGCTVHTGPGTDPSPVLVGGRWLFDGYWTADGFEPRIGESFDTGDGGFVHDGQLFVLGRRSDVVSVAGHNVFAEDVEAVALAAAGTPGQAAAAFTWEAGGDRFGLVIEVGPRQVDDVERLARAVRAAVAETLGTRLAALAVVRPGVIPRTTSGKVQRGACRDAYRSGAVPARRLLAELT